jgi:hypothetical protein
VGYSRSGKKKKNSRIKNQPSAINHQPSTINHQPSTINHQESSHMVVRVASASVAGVQDNRIGPVGVKPSA